MKEATPYNDVFFEYQQTGSLRSAQVVVPLVLQLARVQSVVDVGCGIGTWLSVFKQLGVPRVRGIDGHNLPREKLRIAPEEFTTLDLTAPFVLPAVFDLAVCLEVAEHLPESSAAGLVQSLVRLAPLVLFSAAIPCQGGIGHINEQWPDYWERLFRQHDYVQLDCLRHRIWHDDRIECWYRQNLFLFVRSNELRAFPDLQQLHENQSAERWLLINAEVLDAYVGPRKALKRLPGQLCRALWRRLRRGRPS